MEILIVLAVVLLTILSIKKVRTYLKIKLNIFGAKGSAFVKIAEADAKELEIKGRIVAIDDANKVKQEAVAFYEKEAARVHADAETVKSGFDAVLAKL